MSVLNFASGKVMERLTTGGRREDSNDRRDSSQGAPHGDQSAVEKGGAIDQTGRVIGRTKTSMNTKLHAVANAVADRGLIRFLLSAGQISDHKFPLSYCEQTKRDHPAFVAARRSRHPSRVLH